jgi:uncharacterized membrane protein YecN with MAPEG domain
MTIWLPISLTIAAAAALINVWLSIRVGQVRTREKVMVGDGGNDAVIRRMRAHANFIENAPFVLILIALIELSCGQSTWLWAAGVLFLIGRVAHAFGMDGPMRARFVGTLITLLTLVGLAGAAIYVTYAKDKPAASEAAGRVA